MEFKGSKTEKNLMDAYAAESMGRTKYTFYASKAKKDGYERIAEIFELTANNEKEHAEVWFKYLNGGELSHTLQNLEDAAKGEYFEWTKMYKDYAKIARDEGFTDIALHFDMVASVEKFHNERYDKLLEDVKQDRMFKSPMPVLWQCANCGFHIMCENAPEVCPLCSHPKSYFFNTEEQL